MSLNFTIPMLNINQGENTQNQLQFFRRGFNLSSSYSPSYQDVTVTGNDYVNLPNAKANGLNYLKLYGGCEQRLLPEGYTQLEYIDTGSTSGAYIELNLQPDGDSVLEMKCSTTANTAQFMVATPSTSNLQYRIVKFTSGSKVGGSIGATNYNSTYDGSTPVTIRIDHKKIYADGELIGDGTENPISDSYTKINIMRGYYSSSAVYYSIGKVYYAYISIDGVNPDFYGIPAQRNSDNEVGLYDIANDVFYPSTDSEHSFTAGSTATPTPNIPQPIYCNNGEIKLKNLFDESTMVVEDCYIRAGSPTAQYPIGSEVRLTGVGDYNCSTFIPIEPSTQYTTIIPSFASISAGLCYYTGTTVDTVISGVPLYTQGSATYTFTTPSNCNYIRFSWKNDKGNACKLYSKEIYADGIIETVSVRGKNLWTINPPTHTGINSSGGWNSNDTSTGGRYKVPCKPSTEYTVSWFNNGDDSVVNMCWGFWDANDDWIKRVKSTGATVTTPENAAYLTSYYYIASGTTINENTTMQIEEGETASAYEPYYNGGSATAQNLLAVGTYKDVQSVLDGAITKNVGVLVFNGTEDWEYTNSRFRLVISDYLIGSSITALIISHYKLPAIDSGTIANGEARFSKTAAEGTVSSNNLLVIHDDNYTSLDNYKSWLAQQYANGTPVIIVYPLATTTTESVTPQTLTTKKGSNTIEITQASITPLPLEANYKAGVSVTITEVENANLDNSVTVTIS